MNCPNCGLAVNETTVFCSHCGHRIGSTAAKPTEIINDASKPDIMPTRETRLVDNIPPTREMRVPDQIGKTREIRVPKPPSPTRVIDKAEQKQAAPEPNPTRMIDDTLANQQKNEQILAPPDQDKIEKPAGKVGAKTQLYTFGKVPAQMSTMQLILKIDQQSEKKVYSVKEKATIGRESGDIVITDPFISGTHAEIVQREGKFYLRDLNSSNGVFVRITDEIEIEEGTEFLLGKHQFIVQKIEKEEVKS